MPSSLLTQSEWSRQQGFSRQYASELVKKGIVVLVNKKVDVEQANAALAAMRNPAKEQTRNTSSTNMEASDLSKQLLTARIKNEKEKGKILEMKAKTEAGEYISVDAVEKRAFDKARMVRDHLLNIPDRIAPMLLSISDEHEVHSLLTEEIRLALEGLCDD